MWLSDISVKRPVFATVLSLLLMAFGALSFERLPLREYPNIDPPIVSISTNYRGAAAEVVESRITQLIEDRVAGVAGIKFLSSQSSNGRSRVTLEFSPGYDVDEAANDLRDRVSGLLNNLPPEADPPEVRKENSDDDVIVWFSLMSDQHTTIELTDYVRRYLQDRLATVDGVARVRIGGGLEYSMRIWLNRRELAARNLTVADVESAIRSQNIELPAGSIESEMRQFSVRVERSFKTVSDFQNLVVGKDKAGYIVRLSDVAAVEQAPEQKRTLFRGNRLPTVGIGVIKQSTANTLDVARAVEKEVQWIAETLPAGMKLEKSYDRSVFVSEAISEVYSTLMIAILLVIVVIYAFLGSFRAVLVPAVAVPVSLLATFIVIYALGYTVNLFTLLALVLAIGLVVDDGIVVLENIYRRLKSGETPLVASYLGAKQVGFAVVATTAVLVAVFLPITFLEGDLGRLFGEFSVTMSASVMFSTFVALSLSPMLCSIFLRNKERESKLTIFVNRHLAKLSAGYRRSLVMLLSKPLKMLAVLAVFLVGGFLAFRSLPSEFAPREDRGAFFILVKGPEGASFEFISEQMLLIEDILMPYVDSGEARRVLIRAPRGFGGGGDYSGGFAIVTLNDWGQRRGAFSILGELRSKLGQVSGVRAIPIMRSGLGGGVGKPVQFVLGGSDFKTLAKWRDVIVAKASANPGLLGLEDDYDETRPQLIIDIDKSRSADLGVSVLSISRTLESMLGSRIVTSYENDGEEYNVIIQGLDSIQRSPKDIENIFVRSELTGDLIPLSNLISIREKAAPSSLNRYNRMKAITISADLADGYSLDEALTFMEQLVRNELPAGAVIDYKGSSLDLKESSGSIFWTIFLALLVVFLVLAAQFESFIQPFVILLTVPFALVGAFIGLYITGASINIYSQISFIMLIGLAAKNGILIVEFINQMRDSGKDFTESVIEGASIRLRPIIMTVLTTVMGSLPLIISSGAGSETRFVVGVVLFFGVLLTSLVAIYLVPVVYHILCKSTVSPETIQRRLETELKLKDVSI